MHKPGLAILATFVSLNMAAPAAAEGRDNPFTPPPTKAEEQARQDERVRLIIRQQTPEIQQKIMQDVSSAQAGSELRLRRRIDEVAASVKTATEAAQAAAAAVPASTPGAPQPGTPTAPGQKGQSPASGVPEGSKFISCVNGKALYRDKDNTTFMVSGAGPAGIDRCAR